MNIEVILINRKENKNKWQTRINDQQESNLTQMQWCSENDVNIHTFRYWKNRLGKTLVKNTPQNQFVAVKPAIKLLSSSMKISIGCATVEVNESSSLDLFNDIVKVLIRYA